MRGLIYNIWWINVLLVMALALPAWAQTAAQRDVPEGFEDLLRPQTNLVDVYFGGRLLGQVQATFEPGRLTFADPAAVARLVPEIENAAPVVEALTGVLNTNAGLICPGGRERPGCGELKTAVAGIIFDDARFRVDLFINPDYLRIRPAESSRFVPTPTREWSFVQFTSGAVSASTGRESLFNLRNRSVFAMRGARAIADLSVSNQRDLLVDSLLGEVDRKGRHYAGGLFRTRGLNLVGQAKILGLRFDTDTRTRLDLEQAEGSPIVVFLPRRAQVEILREGRLLSSAIYEAGNQQLDTRLLPEGAYNLTVRIRENGSVVREEERFFVKSTLLPPKDQPLFVLEAGAIVDDRSGVLPEPTDEPLVRLGARHRFRNWLGFGADLLATRDQVIGELSADFLTRYGTIGLFGLGGTEGDIGVGATMYGRHARFSYSFNLRRVWSGDDSPPFTRDTGFDPINRSFTQLDVRFNYNVGRARVGFVGVLRDGSDARLSYAFGPTLYWPYWQKGPWQADVSGNATFANDEMLFLLTFRLRYSRSGFQAVGFSGVQATVGRDGRTGRDDRIRAIAGLDASYRFRDLARGEVDIFAGARRELDSELARAGAEYRGRYGQGIVTGEHLIGGTGSRNRVSGTYTVGTALNADGFAIGGRQTYDSALIVRLRGSAAGAEFEVVVDGSAKGRVAVGSSAAMFLQPYETYTVRLRPVGKPLVDFDATPRTVSVFPGTAETLVWRIDRVVVVYGRIVRADGTPVAGSLIDGVTGAAETDAEGYFQAEIGGAETEFRLVEADPVCRVSLPQPPPEAEIFNAGTLTCE